jgi:hypothetical protein
MRNSVFVILLVAFCSGSGVLGYVCAARRLSGFPVVYALSGTESDMTLVLSRGEGDVIGSRYVSLHYWKAGEMPYSYYLDHESTFWADARIVQGTNSLSVYRGDNLVAILNKDTASLVNVSNGGVYPPETNRAEILYRRGNNRPQ